MVLSLGTLNPLEDLEKLLATGFESAQLQPLHPHRQWTSGWKMFLCLSSVQIWSAFPIKIYFKEKISRRSRAKTWTKGCRSPKISPHRSGFKAATCTSSKIQVAKRILDNITNLQTFGNINHGPQNCGCWIAVWWNMIPQGRCCIGFHNWYLFLYCDMFKTFCSIAFFQNCYQSTKISKSLILYLRLSLTSVNVDSISKVPQKVSNDWCFIRWWFYLCLRQTK